MSRRSGLILAALPVLVLALAAPCRGQLPARADRLVPAGDSWKARHADPRHEALLYYYVAPWGWGEEAAVDYVSRGGQHPAGVVAILSDAFVCAPHRLGFATRDLFVRHLRYDHQIATRAVPDQVVRRGSRSVFFGAGREHLLGLPVIRARQGTRPTR